MHNNKSLSLQSINNQQSIVQNSPAIKNQHDDVTEQSHERGYLKNLDPQQHSPIHYPLSPNVIISSMSSVSPSDSPRSTPHQEVTKNIPRVLQQASLNEENFPITKLSTDSEETSENILMNELNDILNNINTTIAPLYDSMSTIRNAFYEYAQRIQRAVNDVDNYCELKLKEVTEVNKKQSELSISEDSASTDNSDDKHVKINKQSSSFTLPPDYKQNQDIFTKESSKEKLNKNKVNSKCNSQHELDEHFPITTKTSNDSNGIIENTFISEFNNILNIIDVTLARKHESMTTIYQAFSDYTKTFKEVITDVKSYCDLKDKNVTKSNNKQTESTISSLPEGTSAARDKDQQTRKDNPDVEDVILTKKPRLFVLPPDYDPNDTRWTLRHRKPGPKIVELIPKNNIYVNKNRLGYSCAVAKNCNELTIMLLQIIFSASALSVCSLTGERVIGKHGSNIRPGLDEHALGILLIFIKKHGVSKGWQVPDTLTFVNIIQSKLKAIRRKPSLFW